MNAKLFAASAFKVLRRDGGRSTHVPSTVGYALVFLLAVLVFAAAAAVVVNHDLPLVMGGM